jgi:hypothetical protein
MNTNVGVGTTNRAVRQQFVKRGVELGKSGAGETHFVAPVMCGVSRSFQMTPQTELRESLRTMGQARLVVDSKNRRAGHDCGESRRE